MRLVRVWWGTILVLMVIAAPLLAADDGLKTRLGNCAAIKAKTERLNCFDVLAKSVEAKDTGNTRNKGSAWIVSSRVSAMDDKTNVYLLVRAEQEVETKYFGKVRPRLWIQCIRGQTKGVLEWGFIVGGGQEAVTYRLDQDKPVATTVSVSEDFSALVSWDEKRFIPFVKSLFGKKRLLVEITPFSDPPLTAAFNITGTEKAIAPLRAACGW